MRPLETLLLSAALLTLCALALPTVRAARWIRHSAPFTLLIAGAQVLVEGPRWQMIPAYILSGVFFLVWLLQNARPATVTTTAHSRFRQLALALCIGSGVLGLAVSAVLSIVFPVFRFPHPHGPYAIGTLTYHWTDVSRPEIFTIAADDRRELMVQVWYPAEASQSATHAPYVRDGAALAPLAELLHLPPFIFRHFEYVTTNAVPSAPPARGEPRYPTLIFLHGRGGFRQHNTSQVEELVSHGYVVAAIDHSYAASGVVFPDGRLAAFDTRMRDRKFEDRMIPYLARDAIFTLDQLAALNRADPNGLLTGLLDLQRVGIFGMSLGGAVSAEACRLESRLRACLVMDVFTPVDVVKAGLQQPTMWISRDVESMQLEGWARADIDETQDTMRAAFEHLRGWGYLVRVHGMFHADFTDAPLYSPLNSSLGITGPIDAQRARTITNAYSLAFFDRHLKGAPAPLLDGPAEQYPGVLFETRRRSKPETPGSEQRAISTSPTTPGAGPGGGN